MWQERKARMEWDKLIEKIGKFDFPVFGSDMAGLLGMVIVGQGLNGIDSINWVPVMIGLIAFGFPSILFEGQRWAQIAEFVILVLIGVFIALQSNIAIALIVIYAFFNSLQLMAIVLWAVIWFLQDVVLEFICLLAGLKNS